MSGAVSRRGVLTGALGVSALGLLSSCAGSPAAPGPRGLPAQLVWSTYPAGTGTYNDIAAIANALTRHSDVQVRVLGGDTGIGRLAPVLSGVAQYSRAGDEHYFAFEGDFEYASPTWGPTRLRQIWAPPGQYGVLARRDSGIKTVEDLRGRKIPKLIASTSMNMKIQAILNLAGIAPDEVEWVSISYGGQAEGIKTGQIDLMYQNILGASVEELATENPFFWLDLNGYPEEAYESWRELCPMVKVAAFDNGAGMQEGEVRHNMRYAIPLTTLAERPAAEVTALLHEIARNYENFKDATPDAPNFGPQQVMLDPIVIPYHEGAVAYFREIGRWTEAHQRVQDALLEREERMQAAWPGFLEEHEGAEDISDRWREWKKQNLPAVMTVAEAMAELGMSPEEGTDA